MVVQIAESVYTLTLSAAERDRICVPTHAELLAKHFRAELVTFPGAHLLQFGRRAGFGAIARFLVRHGVIAARA